MLYFLLVFWYLNFVATVFSKCDKDRCYNHFNQLVRKEKNQIQHTFDGILDRYGEIDKDLEKLLDELEGVASATDQKLNDFASENENLGSKIVDLSNEVEDIKNKLNNLNVTESFSGTIPDTSKMNKIIPVFTFEDLDRIEKDLDDWADFIKRFTRENIAKDILNIPYSVSDDITLLEYLVDNNEGGQNCFNEFHADLKLLFEELSKLMDFDPFLANITKLKRRADDNRKKLEEILTDTETVLQEERRFKRINDLAQQTQDLAEEIHKLKATIDAPPTYKLGKSFEDQLNKLFEEYEIDDIMKHLRTITEENKPEELESIFKEIECYSEFLENCKLRKAAETTGVSNECLKRVAELVQDTKTTK